MTFDSNHSDVIHDWKIERSKREEEEEQKNRRGYAEATKIEHQFHFNEKIAKKKIKNKTKDRKSKCVTQTFSYVNRDHANILHSYISSRRFFLFVISMFAFPFALMHNKHTITH